VTASVQDRFHDGNVTRASAKVARQNVSNPVLVSVRFVGQKCMSRGNETRRAKAALESVMLAKTGL
jgi:hypothetical protein